MVDELLPFPLPQGSSPVLTFPAPRLADDRFDRMAAEDVDMDRAVSDLARRRTPVSRGTSDYRIRLDATRLAHQARSWDELTSLVRRQLQSHAISSPGDAKLLIDIATSAYGAEHRDSDGALMYGFALQKEYDDKQATARQQQIAVRGQQLRSDPILRANLEWQDRVQKLADETGLEYQFVSEFIKEFDRLSVPRHPGVIDPRGVPLFQAEAELAGIAYMFKEYLYPFIPGAGVVTGAISLYEGVRRALKTGGKRFATISIYRLRAALNRVRPLVFLSYDRDCPRNFTLSQFGCF